MLGAQHNGGHFCALRAATRGNVSQFRVGTSTPSAAGCRRILRRASKPPWPVPLTGSDGSWSCGRRANRLCPTWASPPSSVGAAVTLLAALWNSPSRKYPTDINLFRGSPFALLAELKPCRRACNCDSQLNVEHQRNRAGSEFGHRLPSVMTLGKCADPSEWQKQGNAALFLSCAASARDTAH